MSRHLSTGLLSMPPAFLALPIRTVPGARTLGWSVASLALLSCAPATMPGAPEGAAPDERAPAGGDATGTRVFASRHEVRVVFPPDTVRAWGWSESDEKEYRPGYGWGIYIEGTDEPKSLVLTVDRNGPRARTFRSLAGLVAAGSASLCSPGMVARCSGSGVTAFVDWGRVVLALRDSAVVSRLFGLRPEWVEVWQRRPEEGHRYPHDRVRVEYVDPQVPEPDSAFIAEAARARRRYEARINTITRSIAGGPQDWGALWLAVGDSVALRIEEMHCRFDSCGGSHGFVADSGWVVADTSVVRLHTIPEDSTEWWRWRFTGRPRAYVVARRPGRTQLRVVGLHGSSDTLPSSPPVARRLEREIVVTLPVERVEISPRVDTVRVGAQVEFRARAFDHEGRLIEGAPVELVVPADGYTRVSRTDEPVPLLFDKPGREILTASFGGRADTLTVVVVGKVRH